MTVPHDGFKAVLISDVHQTPDEDFHPSYQLVREFVRDERPDLLVDLGDWFDFRYLSSFDEEDNEMPRKQALFRDYDKAAKELDYLQRYCGTVVKIEGNHELRIERYIAKFPVLRGLVEPEAILQYEARGIQYIRQTDKPYFRVGKLAMVHGWYTNLYHTAKTLRVYGGNIIYGHVHHFQSDSSHLQAHDQDIGAWSIGCLTDTSPDYVKGVPTRHNNGFAVVYFDRNGGFNIYPIYITNNQFIWNGKCYSQSLEEGEAA